MYAERKSIGSEPTRPSSQHKKKIYLPQRLQRARIRRKYRRQRTRAKGEENHGKGAEVFVPRTKGFFWREQTHLVCRKMSIYKGKRGNPVLG